MDKGYLILKRAAASRSSGEWNDDDFDVLADDVVVGRIIKAAAAPVDAPWMSAGRTGSGWCNGGADGDAEVDAADAPTPYCARVDYINNLQENLKGQEAASDEVRAEFKALVEQCRAALRDRAEEND